MGFPPAIERPKNWKTLATILILSSAIAGIGAVYVPLMVFYALELGAPLPIATAAIMSYPTIVALILVFPLSIYADRSGKRLEIMVIAMVVGIVTHLLLLIRSVPIFILSRLLAGLAFAVGPIGTFIYANIVPPERLGTMLALSVGTMTLASGLFQVFSGAIFTALGSRYDMLFYLAAIGGFIALLMVIPVYMKIWRLAHIRLPGMKFSDIATVLKTKTIYWVGISICIYLIGWNLMYPTLSYVVRELYQAPIEIATAVFGAASLMLGLGTYMWGPILDRWGGRKTLTFALLASAITTFIMYFALASLWGYVVFFMLLTVFGVVGAPGVSYVAVRSVRPELITVAVSVPWVFVYIASILGGFLSGAFLESVGLYSTVLIAAVVELIGAIMMTRLPKI
ncbi:MAG: MFS transporter [Ignisphaera sp.]